MGAPDPPDPPDPEKTIAAQSEANKEAVQASITASQTDQFNPFGSMTYHKTGEVDQYGNPRYEVRTNLNPQQQALLDAMVGNQTSISAHASDLVNNTFGRYGQDFDPNAGGVDSIVNQRMAHQVGYLNPFFEQNTNALDAQLRNQGLEPGTKAYDNALRTLRDNQQQSVQGFLAQIQPQAYQQAVADYNRPMETFANLSRMSSPAGFTPTNTPTFQSNTTDAIGAYNNAFNAQMQAYNAQASQQNALLGGLFGMAGTMMGGPIGGAMGQGIGGLFG